MRRNDGPSLLPVVAFAETGAPFSFRATNALLELVRELSSFESARAFASAAKRALVVLNRGAASFAKTQLAPSAALEILDGMAGALVLVDLPLPPLVDAAAELAERLDLALPSDVRVRLILSRAGSSTPIHFDDATSFNIQLSGRKAWRMSVGRPCPPVLDAEGAYVGLAEEPTADDGMSLLGPTFVMMAGDGVYLPAGTLHRVDGIDDSVSLSISFGQSDVRWVDALVTLTRKLLLEDPAARMPATELADSASIVARLGAALEGVRGEDLLPEDDGDDTQPLAWNPAGTMRIDHERDGRALITAGIAGTMGESGKLRVTTATADAVRDLRRDGWTHEPAFVAKVSRSQAAKLRRSLRALGLLVPRSEMR